jgi:hypothetical protein
LGLETIFYCLRFETSLFVASYDSQGHGGGIRSLHTGHFCYIEEWVVNMSSLVLWLQKGPTLLVPDER